MLKNLSRKIGKQSKRISRKISRKISRRFNKTIKNDSIKVRQFYKSMLKKFKGGCTSCATIGGKPIKGG
jgi:HSP90 family molecular chaperone